MTAIQPCVTEWLPVLNSATNMHMKRCREQLAHQWGMPVVRHADHHDHLNVVLRTNRTVVLALLWGALAGCVVGSVVYDVAEWIGAW